MIRKGKAVDEKPPFWRTKTLEELTPVEWESLCDGCGRCCLNKLEYEDTGEIEWTDLACVLLDGQTCRCTDYKHRHQRVSGCIALTPESVRKLNWLPPTCGYRLVAEGRDLYWWHPLFRATRKPCIRPASPYADARRARSASRSMIMRTTLWSGRVKTPPMASRLRSANRRSAGKSASTESAYCRLIAWRPFDEAGATFWSAGAGGRSRPGSRLRNRR